MPKPTTSTTVSRPDLGMIVFEHTMDAAARGFVGLSLLPPLPVAVQTGIYPQIVLESVLKLIDTSRQSRGAYARDDYEYEDGNFATKEQGLEEPLDDRERAIYEGIYGALDTEEVASLRGNDHILRNQEKRVADLLFNATTFASYTAAVSTEWSTTASCTPVSDVKAAKRSVRQQCGLPANAIVFNRTVFDNLTLCAAINDKIKYGGTPFEALAEAEQIAALSKAFGLQVFVAGATYDSAKKGQAASIADLWDDEYAWVGRIATSQRDIKEPCIGRTFLWNENSLVNPIVETYREEQTRSDILRIRHDVQEKIILVQCGYLLSNITA